VFGLSSPGITLRSEIPDLRPFQQRPSDLLSLARPADYSKPLFNGHSETLSIL